jgi:hypothetical protein
MSEKRGLATEAEAIALAIRLTGLDAVSKKASAEKIIIVDDKTPFLWRQLLNRRAWTVKFEPGALHLKSSIPGFQDRYPRKFSVLLDERTGQLLKVEARFEGDDPDMRPAPSGDAAEAQLRAEKEIFTGLPVVEPKLTLLDALDVVLKSGIGSPFLAKEIEAVYVMHSRMGSSPRPVWSITLRGLPPMPARGQHADTIPSWQRNHMRNVIDAVSGEFVFATNSPQPD